MATRRLKIAVVGGGVAAIACCKALEDMDYAITVFDDEGGKVPVKPGVGFRVLRVGDQG